MCICNKPFSLGVMASTDSCCDSGLGGQVPHLNMNRKVHAISQTCNIPKSRKFYLLVASWTARGPRHCRGQNNRLDADLKRPKIQMALCGGRSAVRFARLPTLQERQKLCSQYVGANVVQCEGHSAASERLVLH